MDCSAECLLFVLCSEIIPDRVQEIIQDSGYGTSADLLEVVLPTLYDMYPALNFCRFFYIKVKCEREKKVKRTSQSKRVGLYI